MAWRGVAWRGVAWRGVALLWRGVVALHCCGVALLWPFCCCFLATCEFAQQDLLRLESKLLATAEELHNEAVVCVKAARQVVEREYCPILRQVVGLRSDPRSPLEVQASNAAAYVCVCMCCLFRV